MSDSLNNNDDCPISMEYSKSYTPYDNHATQCRMNDMIPTMQRLFSFTSASIIVAAILISLIVQQKLADANANYAAAISQLKETPARTVKLSENADTIHIPAANVFGPGSLWELVSKTYPIANKNVDTQNLMVTSIAHGDAESLMKVDKRMEPALRQLVDAAEEDGVTLMISSAFRSVADQQKTLEVLSAQLGTSEAKKIVAPPGSSEHHTGLAVDFSDASTECATDSDKCSLGYESAVWLREHAPDYGFILRYDQGSEDITGYDYEPWHYRYVGKPLAQAVYQSKLTFEEATHILRPGTKER